MILSRLICRCAVMAFFIRVTHLRPVAAQTIFARTILPTCAVETPFISSGLSISVAMATTSGFLQAVFVAQHLRGVEWWGKVMLAVGTPLILSAGAEFVCAVRCTIPYHPGSAVAGKLSPLYRSAVVTKHLGQRTTRTPVKYVAEVGTFPMIRACAARDQRVTLW